VEEEGALDSNETPIIAVLETKKHTAAGTIPGPIKYSPP
jgi:hypothetical protein